LHAFAPKHVDMLTVLKERSSGRVVGVEPCLATLQHRVQTRGVGQSEDTVIGLSCWRHDHRDSLWKHHLSTVGTAQHHSRVRVLSYRVVCKLLNVECCWKVQCQCNVCPVCNLIGRVHMHVDRREKNLLRWMRMNPAEREKIYFRQRHEHTFLILRLTEIGVALLFRYDEGGHGEIAAVDLSREDGACFDVVECVALCVAHELIQYLSH